MKPPTLKPTKIISLSPKLAEWNDMEDVRAALKGQPVTISGTTVDLRDCQIKGNKFPKPKDDQDENSVPIHIRINKFTLKNGSISGIPGGIVFKGDKVTFSDLTFVDIGEDALSNMMDQSPNSSVINCKFYNSGGDKSLQLNDARGAIIKNSFFTGGITAIRLQKKATKIKGIKTKEVSGNTFEDVDTAFNIAGGVKVVASGNTYKNVKHRWINDSGATHDEKS